MRPDNLEDKNRSFSNEQPPTTSSWSYMVQYKKNQYEARDGVMALQGMDQICTKPLNIRRKRKERKSYYRGLLNASFSSIGWTLPQQSTKHRAGVHHPVLICALLQFPQSLPSFLSSVPHTHHSLYLDYATISMKQESRLQNQPGTLEWHFWRIIDFVILMVSLAKLPV